MNRRLTDHDIRSTCQDLIAQDGCSGRQLQRALRVRYGAVGKTDRVFRIWREVEQSMRPPLATTPDDDLAAQLRAAQAEVLEQRARAERSEFRERAHQDQWAQQVDQLRQRLQAQPGLHVQIRGLQDQVQRLSIDLMAARTALSRYADL